MSTQTQHVFWDFSSSVKIGWKLSLVYTKYQNLTELIYVPQVLNSFHIDQFMTFLHDKGYICRSIIAKAQREVFVLVVIISILSICSYTLALWQ